MCEVQPAQSRNEMVETRFDSDQINKVFHRSIMKQSWTVYPSISSAEISNGLCRLKPKASSRTKWLDTITEDLHLEIDDVLFIQRRGGS